MVSATNVTGLAMTEPDTFRKEGTALTISFKVAYMR